MSGRRDAGTNPRAMGTNPRAQADAPPVASSEGEGREAGREVATQIPEVTPQILTDGSLTSMVTDPLVPDGVAHSLRTDPEWTVGEKKENPSEVNATSLAELADEKDRAQDSFMAQAVQAQAMAGHDDECPSRKGKECSCRALLSALATEKLPELERKPMRWMENGILRNADLVRVDNGREVLKVIPDPISQTAKPITVSIHEPPRWVCLQCASSMRGTDLDHHCDPAVKAKAQAPLALSKQLPPDVKFGGAYRLTLWRDRQGEYHIGEEVVVGGKVIEERHLVGPESWNVIEGAMLDHADSRLTP